MVVYDSKGVPVLRFTNPAGSILYPRGLYTYAMGNTRGRDVTENLGTKKEQHLAVLLLASGDARNVFFTVSGMSLRKPPDRPKCISFHLNDYNPSIVARNAIILEIANTMNPDVQDDVDFLWNIWYNMTLPKPHFDRLRAVLTSLIERNFEGSEGFLKFQDSNVLQECRGIWNYWSELDLDVKSVKQDRNELLQEENISQTGLISMKTSHISMSVSEMDDILSPGGSFFQEIEHWFLEGSTNDDQHSVNPTLIDPFVHKWRIDYFSCAFDGYMPFLREDVKRCGSFTGVCKESLKLLVKRFQQYQHVTPLEITFWNDDALSLCSSGLPRDLMFDVIDTSNVSDYIGLLNVLVCCSPRLKRPLESQLFTASMAWWFHDVNCNGMTDYYDKCVGIHTYLLPTVLGLKLAVDFDLGSRNLPRKEMGSEEIFCWVRAARTRTLLTVDERSDIVYALLRLAERCFNLPEEWNGQKYGVNLSSPLTFLRIIQQLHPLIKEEAFGLFDLLQQKLPTDFHHKFGLSWNLIKASIDKHEPIVEIKVHVNISTENKSTPMPMIVILDQKDIEKRLIQSPVGHDAPVIYNSLRYDEEKRVITFHLLEKDWNRLKDKSWLTVVSNNRQPSISSETVFLGDESVVLSVRQVDPVETFGLSSVQTFDICPSKDSKVLKISKVEENESSYKAELAMLELTKCKKSEMKINFHPDSYPAEVNVKFGKDSGCKIYVSCPVDKNSSKFQISRKQSKVTCQMPKRGDGTVGERVLQNPAPVPFHALKPWDGKLKDMERACNRMFRTQLDLHLAHNGINGEDAFYDMRESISLILKEHVKQHHMYPLIYCVEERDLVTGYKTSEDFSKKKGLIIKVLSIYRWNSLPIAKVIFYDFKRYGDVIKTNYETFLKFSTLWFKTCPIMANQKEIDLFRKMLYINAERVSQEDIPDDVWKASFISLLFPRENVGIFQSLRHLVRQMNEEIHTESIPKKTASTEKLGKEFPSSTLVDSKNNTQSTFVNVEDADRVVNVDPSPTALSEPTCNFCFQNSGNLKKCMGCKKAFYCSKDCQKSDWKQHKTVCRKN